MEVGDRDLLNPNVMRDNLHDWVLANEHMAKVLAAKGYHYQFVFARNAGHVDRAAKQQTLPEALPHLRFSLCTVSAECGPLLASGPALTRISTPEGASSKLCFGGVFDVRSSLPFAPCRSETHPFFNSAKCESCDEQP